MGRAKKALGKPPLCQTRVSSNPRHHHVKDNDVYEILVQPSPDAYPSVTHSGRSRDNVSLASPPPSLVDLLCWLAYGELHAQGARAVRKTEAQTGRGRSPGAPRIRRGQRRAEGCNQRRSATDGADTAGGTPACRPSPPRRNPPPRPEDRSHQGGPYQVGLRVLDQQRGDPVWDYVCPSSCFRREVADPPLPTYWAGICAKSDRSTLTAGT